VTTWTLAGALGTLRAEVDALWPDRSKLSDGTLGDPAHQARTSDHNPDADGVVRAWDCTAWVGPDGNVADLLAEHLRATRDPRVKYVIRSSRMFSSYPTSSTPAWTWRPYTGTNPHDKHTHVSVQPAPPGDDPSPWHLEESLMPTPAEIAAAVWAHPVGSELEADGRTRTTQAMASQRNYRRLASLAARPTVDVNALAVALAAALTLQQTPTGTLTPEAVRQACADAVRAVLGSLDVTAAP
jgi:hypothetical protein